MKNVLSIVLCVFYLNSCTYLPEPFELTSINIEENTDFIILSSNVPTSSRTFVLFYPGGLVDPHSYIKNLEFLTLMVSKVVIAKLDGNLAVLDQNKADTFIDEYGFDNVLGKPNLVIMGHSLGGAMACSYLHNNINSFDAAILLASYPTENFSLLQFSGNILSLTGTNDEVLDSEKFEANKMFLPEGIEIESLAEMPDDLITPSTIYYEISGGNHSQFGSYGDQSGDGTSSIMNNEQIELVNNAFLEFFKSIGWF